MHSHLFCPTPLTKQEVKTLTHDSKDWYNESSIKNALDIARVVKDHTRPESYHAARLRRLVLYLDRCRSSGRIQPRVDVLHPEAHTVNADRQFAAELNNASQSIRRQPPPEIRLANGEKPTEESTVQLFELDEVQALAFRFLARTVMAEKNNEKVPQLRMAISGQAGTGKSEVLKALIWYSFQHDMNRLLGVSSFQWKAAILIRTPNTPAVSSCTFYGIDPFKKILKPESVKSSQYFHSDIRILCLEEGGTTSLEFFSVSMVLYVMTCLITIPFDIRMNGHPCYD